MTYLTCTQRSTGTETCRRNEHLSCWEVLTNKISDDIKSTVICLYLQATSRHDIARTCGVGEGTLSNSREIEA